MVHSRDYNATVVDRRPLHETLFHLWIRPDGGEVAPFEPGQFVSIGRRVDERGKLMRRTYSIGSSARRRDAIELFIVHVEGGEFTSWLREQQAGARLWLSPKASGGFTLAGVPPDKDLVLVSTGTAIAPYLSMYRTYRDDPPWRRIVIVNGVRFARDLGFRDELEQAAADDPRLVYLPLVTRPAGDPAWAGLRGRVQTVLDPDRYAEIVGERLTPERCHVFLCGNPAMIAELEPELIGRGFTKHTRHTPGTLHLERYW